jgi:hypothetical protein
VCSVIKAITLKTDMVVSIELDRPPAHCHLCESPVGCHLRRDGSLSCLDCTYSTDKSISLYCRDSQVHHTLVADFDGFVQRYGADVRSWSDPKARVCCLGMLLHMADISNVAKPISLAVRWAKGVSKGELVRTGTVVWLPAQAAHIVPTYT